MSRFELQAAKDAAQEAMAEAFWQWSDITSPKAWVRRAALRAAVRDQKRDTKRGKRERTHALRERSTAAENPAHSVELSEEHTAVSQWLASLPPTRRRVAALRFDGYTVKEVAERLGISETTVRSHLRHVRESGPGGQLSRQAGGGA